MCVHKDDGHPKGGACRHVEDTLGLSYASVFSCEGINKLAIMVTTVAYIDRRRQKMKVGSEEN